MNNKQAAKIIKIIVIASVVVLFAFYAYSYYNHNVTIKSAEENRAVLSLIESLKVGDKAAQANALRAMAEMGESAVRPLISALEDESLKFRRKAADALISIGDPAVKPLIDALADEHQKIRRSAAFALEKGDPAWVKSDDAIKSIPHLIASFKSSDESLREDAVTMLSKIGDPAVKPLIETLADEVWYVREASVAALGKIKSEASVEPLIDRLSDDHWQVRRTAAYALGKMESTKAVNPLRDALRDGSSEVKLTAKKSLQRLALVVEEPRPEE